MTRVSVGSSVEVLVALGIIVNVRLGVTVEVGRVMVGVSVEATSVGVTVAVGTTQPATTTKVKITAKNVRFLK